MVIKQTIQKNKQTRTEHRMSLNKKDKGRWLTDIKASLKNGRGW